MDGASKAQIPNHLVDGKHDGPEGRLWNARLPVQQEVQSVWRTERITGNTIAPGFASLLARSRSCDGRRILPPVFHARRVGQWRTRAWPLVQRHAREQSQRLGYHCEAVDARYGNGWFRMVDADNERIRSSGRI